MCWGKKPKTSETTIVITAMKLINDRDGDEMKMLEGIAAVDFMTSDSTFISTGP